MRMFSSAQESLPSPLDAAHVISVRGPVAVVRDVPPRVSKRTLPRTRHNGGNEDLYGVITILQGPCGAGPQRTSHMNAAFTEGMPANTQVCERLDKSGAVDAHSEARRGDARVSHHDIMEFYRPSRRE